MTLNSPLTVVSLMNGMIGGVILVLPVAAYQAGYLYTILAITISGAFSYYSCYLSVKHLGDQKDMNYSMQAHFRTPVAKILYDIVVWLGLLFGSMFYYGLICIQWQSILGKDTIVIPLANAAALFLLIFVLKYFDFGASLMAYGIISIIAYMAFLIWVVSTAPLGQVTWKPFGTNLYNFGATTSLAFAIQAFFIPVLMKNPSKSKHTLLTLIAYIIGGCIYFYISLMGSFGIMNRTALNQDPQTIEDFFKVGNIQLRIIQSIYLIHLYSCLPEFVLISKKRLFNIFKISETKKGLIPYRQVIYTTIFLGICLLIRLLGVKIDTIISINGAIIGFFNIYFFPAVVHVKCLYFSQSKKSLKEKQKQDEEKAQAMEMKTKRYYTLSDTDKSEINGPSSLKDPFINEGNQQQLINEGNQQNQSQKYYTQKINQSSNYSKSNTLQEDDKASKMEHIEKKQEAQESVEPQIGINFFCDCEKPRLLIIKVIEMIAILAMVALGGAIMVNGLISIV